MTDQTVASNARLPRNFVPSQHYVTIIPDFKALTFSGHESIKLKIAYSGERGPVFRRKMTPLSRAVEIGSRSEATLAC